MIPLKNGQKEHSWILFWKQAKICTCRYYGNKQKAEKKTPTAKKKNKTKQVWKQLAMYELFLWSQTSCSNQFTEYKWSNWGQSLSEGPKIY